MTAEVGHHVATGVAASVGFVMPPAVGPGLMVLSTIIMTVTARPRRNCKPFAGSEREPRCSGEDAHHPMAPGYPCAIECMPDSYNRLQARRRCDCE